MLNIRNTNFIKKEVDTKKVDNVKHERIIPITNDSMFKRIFGREDNKKFTCKLLSNIIDISYEDLLNNLKFTKNETGKEKNTDTSYRNDLVLELNDNIINIEMNNNSSEEIRNRNISYIMRLREDKKDKKYHQVIQINLNNYSYKEDNEIVRVFTLSSSDKVILTNLIYIIDIYLPNIMKKSYNNNIKILNELERFLLVGLEENKTKTVKYMGEDIIMKELDEKMEEWTLSDDLRESYDKEWALKDQALRDGLIQKEKEIINTMLENGLSKEEISKYTNIPIDRIEDKC